MDSYLVGFAVIGLGMILAGFNLAATIIHYRAPGMTWGRVPIFVWSILATAALLTLATPTLVAAGLFGVLDRTAQTAFFVNEHGGSTFLWQNLFWFFGHPEVYIMALPGFGIVAEILPVFTRKPLFGYRVAAAGMMGVALLSFFVWQHHLFQSGINPDMRPLFMLTTELISIPTGLHLPGRPGDAVEGEDPLRGADAVRPRHVLQFPHRRRHRRVPVRRPGQRHGARELLRPGPLPLHDHGRPHLRLLRRPLLLAAQDDRPDDGQRLGKIHFWTMFIFFNLTFFPLFIVGLLGQPRRVFEYASNLQSWNDFSSVSAFLLGASFLIFIANFVWTIIIDPSRRPPTRGTRTASSGRPQPGPLLQLRADPGGAERPVPLRRSGAGAGGRPRSRAGGGRGAPQRPPPPGEFDPRPPL